MCMNDAIDNVLPAIPPTPSPAAGPARACAEIPMIPAAATPPPMIAFGSTPAQLLSHRAKEP